MIPRWQLWCSPILVLSLCGGAACAQDNSPGLHTGPWIAYHVTMTTRMAVPDAKKLDQVRVWHALPTKRAWSSTETLGAFALGWRPRFRIRESVLATLDYLRANEWILERRLAA